MSKHYFLPLLFLFSISCASISDQVRSRELLAKCKYELKNVEVENIDFDKMITLANSAKEINFKDPSKDILPLLGQIKDLKFDVDFTTLDIATTIGIENPNMLPVILDSLVLDVFMDETKVTNIIHDGAMEIAPQSSNDVRLVFAMPTNYRLKRLEEANFVNIRGRVWLKIELVKGLPFTIPFNVDVQQKVPKEQIKKLVDAQKKKVVDKIVKELTGGLF